MSATATAAATATIPSRILARGSAYRVVLAPIVFGLLFLGLWQALVTVLRGDDELPDPQQQRAEHHGRDDGGHPAGGVSAAGHRRSTPRGSIAGSVAETSAPAGTGRPRSASRTAVTVA